MSNSIRQIQNSLQQLGYNITIDGIWGPQSQRILEECIASNKGEVYFDFTTFKSEFKVSTNLWEIVDSINQLFLKFNEIQEARNPLYIAYMLGTAWHETSFTMLPIKEIGSYRYLSKYDTGRLAKILGNTPEADGDGQLYAGRGYVQITGRANYSKFSSLLGVDLIKNPDLALDMSNAASILVLGCTRGLFTGVSLQGSIKTNSRADFIKARRVVNGTDKAGAIADYGLKFLNCLYLKVEPVCAPA